MAEDEKEKPEGETPTEGEGTESPSTKDNEGKGDRIQEARHLAERIDRGTKEMKELVDRNEKILADNIISGNAEAGTPQPKKKEMTPGEYAKIAESGGLNENT